MLIGIGKTIPYQHNLTAQIAHSIDFQLRGGHRHNDHRPDTQTLSRKRHSLGMIARRSSDNPALELSCAHVGHLVVSAPQFKTKHRELSSRLSKIRLFNRAEAKGVNSM